MSITKNELNLDHTTLTLLHDKLGKFFLELLNTSDELNPKVLDTIVRFLDNNGISISPTAGMSNLDKKTNLQEVLEGMTLDLEEAA